MWVVILDGSKRGIPRIGSKGGCLRRGIAAHQYRVPRRQTQAFGP